MKKAIKTVAVVTVIAMLSVVNANAWGKKEQGVLIGASAALLLPALLNAGKSNNYANDRVVYRTQPQVQYVQPQVQYVQPQVQYVQPQVQYVQPQTQYVQQEIQYVQPTLPNRQVKKHTYINRPNPGEMVIIEHSDGSRTVIEGR
ncbi:MAG: hypothetical protein ACK5LP_02415 [Campylobacteraceae bacterium]